MLLEACKMYASGGKENNSPSSSNSKCGKSAMLLQLVCSFWTAIRSLSTMPVGTESRDVPLSMSALQPSSQPIMIMFLEALKLLGDVLTCRSGLWRTHHIWRAVLPASAICDRRKAELLKASLALVNRTLQVCFPTTCTRTKLSGRRRWLLSFQTKNPSEPGSLPMQTENAGEWKLSMIVRLSRIFMAMVVSVEAREVIALGGIRPSSSSMETL
mmetsp:Transcript_3988/g.11674  ORF Transcript_3988/g.11674 Transcript_3988/m.11674 type:complete len:214 (-) Transcript_3988:553-1194(-)